ncbi:MAG: DUF488 family protein [Gemmatimonadetes bacterium]|nr:DUF488 family protein [Gemmatimonadota bacterium]
MPLQVKRVYVSPHPEDGLRILVDRLWPRGLAQEAAALDEWVRECAPSDELRKWFAHDRAKWSEFKRRYFAELRSKEELLATIRSMAEKGRVTLLFGASDTECNNAVALMEYLEAVSEKARKRSTPVRR